MLKKILADVDHRAALRPEWARSDYARRELASIRGAKRSVAVWLEAVVSQDGEWFLRYRPCTAESARRATVDAAIELWREQHQMQAPKFVTSDPGDHPDRLSWSSWVHDYLKRHPTDTVVVEYQCAINAATNAAWGDW